MPTALLNRYLTLKSLIFLDDIHANRSAEFCRSFCTCRSAQSSAGRSAQVVLHRVLQVVLPAKFQKRKSHPARYFKLADFPSGHNFLLMTIFEKPQGSRNESRSQPALSNFRIFLRGKISFGAQFFEKPQNSRNESRYHPARSHLRIFIRCKISFG